VIRLLPGLLLFVSLLSVAADSRVEFGVRPHYLIDAMAPGPLRDRLEACRDQPGRVSRFSIGHRGAPLQFPEHTRESYLAAARMGAGLIECDVTFTRDRQLVCRHAQCDLHTTTNILAVPELAARCSEPFRPADPQSGRAASARCCTSDITLAEFRRLCGKMDGADPNAQTVAEYLAGTPSWRTDLYSDCGTLMSHRDSIELIDGLGRDFVPELKEPEVPMPFGGDYGRADYARQLLTEYRVAGIEAHRVWLQSFHWEDVALWLDEGGEFAAQVVYLDARMIEDAGFTPSLADFRALHAQGLRVIAPPLFVLLDSADGRIVPSHYAQLARQAGLELVTWTLERSGKLRDGGGWYFQSVDELIDGDAQLYPVLDLLARDVGVIGVFSDWPATTSFYASCLLDD
jgi:glycerophosphoryl diester phosphodiesterase